VPHGLVFERMPMPGRISSRWGYVANDFTVLDVHCVGRGIVVTPVTGFPG
jgi:hypothetical protein